MLQVFKNGQGSVILRVDLTDSSSATQGPLTGLTSASAGLIIATIADVEATTTRYRASSSEVETISTLGTYAAPTSGKVRFKEVDSTNHPGVYEIQLADARFAVSSAKSLLVTLSGATNLLRCQAVIPLWTVDPYVSGGRMAADMQAVNGNSVSGLSTLSSDYEGGTLAASVLSVGNLSNVGAAWGSSVVGNGRTRDYFLQGGMNKTVRDTSGNTLTVYQTDDSTALMTAVQASGTTSTPALLSVDP